MCSGRRWSGCEYRWMDEVAEGVVVLLECIAKGFLLGCTYGMADLSDKMVARSSPRCSCV